MTVSDGGDDDLDNDLTELSKAMKLNETEFKGSDKVRKLLLKRLSIFLRWFKNQSIRLFLPKP